MKYAQKHYTPPTWKCVFSGNDVVSAYSINVPSNVDINTPAGECSYTVHKVYYERRGKNRRIRVRRCEIMYTGTFTDCLEYINQIRDSKRAHAAHSYGMRNGNTRNYDHCATYNPDDAWSRRPEAAKRRYNADNRKGILYGAFYQTGSSPLRKAVDAHAEKQARHEACTKARTKEDILKVYGY